MTPSNRPLAKREHHFHVLRLHQTSHEAGDVRARHLLLVRTLVTLDHASAVREEVRDDVRRVEPRVFGLHVKDHVLVFFTLLLNPIWARRNVGRRISASSRVTSAPEN